MIIKYYCIIRDLIESRQQRPPVLVVYSADKNYYSLLNSCPLLLKPLVTNFLIYSSEYERGFLTNPIGNIMPEDTGENFCQFALRKYLVGGHQREIVHLHNQKVISGKSPLTASFTGKIKPLSKFLIGKPLKVKSHV